MSENPYEEAPAKKEAARPREKRALFPSRLR